MSPSSVGACDTVMCMDTKLVVVALMALIVGAGGGYVFANDARGQGAHRMPDGSAMHGEMNSMMAGLAGKTGEEFDHAFITEMIVHHEGAVEMAEAALQHAKHEEIKQMANEIISAQTREIEQMKEWEMAWYVQ